MSKNDTPVPDTEERRDTSSYYFDDDPANYGGRPLEDDLVKTGAWDYLRAEPNEDYLTDRPSEEFWQEAAVSEDGEKERLPWEPEADEEEKGKEQDADGEGPGHVRRKHKKHHYFLKFLAFCAVCALTIAFLMSSYFDVAAIEVKGNAYYSPEQVTEISGLKTGTNIFKIKKGDALSRLQKDAHIASAHVERDLPRTVVITIEEREEIAYYKNNKKFIIVDNEGYVLREADAAPELTELVGLSVTEEAVGQRIAVEDRAVLDETLALIKTMEDRGMTFAKIEVNSTSVAAYLTKSLVLKGAPENVRTNLSNGNVDLILKDLESKGITKGTIQVTNNEYCSFSPELE